MKSNPIGIIQLRKKTENKNALRSGVKYFFCTVKYMQTSVKTVMMEMKMYLQITNGPHAYLNEIYGYELPKNKIAMPQ